MPPAAPRSVAQGHAAEEDVRDRALAALDGHRSARGRMGLRVEVYQAHASSRGEGARFTAAVVLPQPPSDSRVRCLHVAMSRCPDRGSSRLPATRAADGRKVLRRAPAPRAGSMATRATSGLSGRVKARGSSGRSFLRASLGPLGTTVAHGGAVTPARADERLATSPRTCAATTHTREDNDMRAMSPAAAGCPRLQPTIRSYPAGVPESERTTIRRRPTLRDHRAGRPLRDQGFVRRRG
jgi:hypothetical protein